MLYSCQQFACNLSEFAFNFAHLSFFSFSLVHLQASPGYKKEMKNKLDSKQTGKIY